ncbi:ATP-binding protein [Streptomyces sp. NPDC048604]|uniref:ATP-binding protein n=1 Tax=Streptomyces sp. NPDC048604 TaxID=3365578 RepID=UPI0037146F7D
MISEPSRHCTVEVQALPSRIGQVRRIVSAHLRYWHLDALIDHAALGLTELLTNVHRHAQPDKKCTVEVELLLDRLTVSVLDHDPRLPSETAGDPDGDPDPYATSGRGLAIVEAVSESWGVRQEGSGKVVWFTLPAPSLSLTAPPRPHAVHGATTDGPFAPAAFVPDDVPFGVPAESVRPHATARSAIAG